MAALTRHAMAGDGGLTLLTGEAGSGKSRLLAELGDRAEAAGLRVLRGRAVPGSGAFRPLAEALVRAAPPALARDERLAPFRSVLAWMLPAWPAGAAPSAHLVDPALVLGEAILELLEVVRSGSRCLVLLDDLHWADEDTLAALQYIAPALGDVPVRIIGAARSDERRPDGLAHLLTRREASHIAVPRMERTELAVLARVCAGDVLSPDLESYLVDAAGGLPLLLEELIAHLLGTGALAGGPGGWRAVRDLAGTVPPGFAEIVHHKAALLAREHREVIVVAALLGQDIRWELLPAATATGRALVAASIRAGAESGLLTVDAAGTPRWRHALTREAVLTRLSAPERADLAATVVDRLDGAGAVEREPALLADLHARAGRPHRAAELLRRQAADHVRAGALAAAADILERAVVLAAGDTGLAVAVRVDHVRALTLTARIDDAVAGGDQELRRAPEPGRSDLAAALADACLAAERFDDAQRYLREIADPAGPRALCLAAQLTLGRGDPRTAAELADRAAAAAERTDQPDLLCASLEVVGRARRRSDPRRAGEALRSALRTAEEHGLAPRRIRALSELGVEDLFEAGDGAALRQAEALAVEAGMLGTALGLALQQTALAASTEGIVDAAARAQRCADRATRLRLDGMRGHALMWVARGRVFADRRDEAGAILDDALRLSVSPVHIHAARHQLAGLDAWLDDDTDGAVAGLGRAVGTLRGAPGANATPIWGEWALLATIADPADGRAREELRSSDVGVQVINRAAQQLADAVAAHHAGDADLAARFLADGRALLVRTPFHRALFESFLTTADGLVDPIATLNSALAWLATTDEVRMVRRCRVLLRRAGGAVPRPARDRGPVPVHLRARGVTGREFEVLGLVAEGLDNPGIAQRLHLSRRTVETHVGRLLAKTGERSRGTLSHWLAPRPD
ncbi:hypothetical protein Pdca_43490 [Pseudonocardia autotrophica]|uniref:Transcriptional regulatory protein DevR (DosR) n=2 Tax=Pseudonocardia TaxID=1847 RepID=A0A1Y2MQ03_PSEAH|nr:Transcriptional regulatory protein DevR (DosR) [Pseudonocardia autotrophica]BBG03140.1 hypothetical protein Pdca_43490 [Pseudonocardia autotrophica]